MNVLCGKVGRLVTLTDAVGDTSPHLSPLYPPRPLRTGDTTLRW